MEPPPVVVVQWTEAARDALRRVGSATIREKIALKVSDLAKAARPESLGKPLRDELQGSYRVPFGRYRIIYEVTRRGPPERLVVEITIRVVLVGIRKAGDKRDVYEEARKLRRRGVI